MSPGVTVQHNNYNFVNGSKFPLLDNVIISDYHLAGGKAYNLSKMLKHGLRVPDGFVISSAVYDAED